MPIRILIMVLTVSISNLAKEWTTTATIKTITSFAMTLILSRKVECLAAHPIIKTKQLSSQKVLMVQEGERRTQSAITTSGSMLVNSGSKLLN